MTWRLAAEDRWDADLALAADADAFQSSAWGEHRRRAGWLPQRWIALDGAGRPVMMAQILTRTIMGTLIGWAPGGPVFGFPAADRSRIPELLESLISSFRASSPRAHLRLDPHHQTASTLTYGFGRVCHRPLVALNTRYSAVLDLRGTRDDVFARMGQKHRYNARRALERPLAWSIGSDERHATELAQLYAQVMREKGVRGRSIQAADLHDVCVAFGERAGILVGSAEGRAITALLFLTFGQRAFLMLPATGAEGRVHGAGYAVHARLFEELQRRRIVSLDMGGLDPRSRMHDVDRFKVGFGATVVEYVGEWEWASAPWLRWMVNAGVSSRRSLA